MHNEIKQFLNDNFDLIKNKDFAALYTCKDFNRLVDNEIIPLGEITCALLNCGIDPLEFMDSVPAFYLESSNINAVSIPGNVTEILECAFSDCKNLKSINIPSSVKYIEDFAFQNSGIQSIDIPQGCELGRGVLMDCDSLKSAALPIKYNSVSGLCSVWGYAYNTIDNLEEIKRHTKLTFK